MNDAAPSSPPTPIPPAASRHQRVSNLFLEACELSPHQREAFLREQCGDDHDLRRRVADLLKHDDSAAAIDHPVVNLGSAAPMPQRIGRYEILGIVGEGGMGTVYRARQENPDRIVALKVMRPGVASRAMIKRFELEARLLGRLQHPGIAQIHEAGTADAGHGTQPYFAMELIEGAPLLEYARERSLPLRQRLEILARICDAVHHAHQKGIVHRDLKPGNILIQSDPSEGPRSDCPNPKILDFGIARVIDPDFRSATLQTDIGQMIGTLPYMSPEQVAGDPHEVDVRSDVYALGVIAYELLTGRLPIDVSDKGMVEAARLIQSASAERLSAIDRSLRGDVETIVAKAMEKNKSRRYQSAWELGEDIRRHLRHEPIVARPPSAIYQFRKFARRHRALVIGTAVAMALLVAAVVGTGYGLVVARQQRDDARRAADRAEAVRQFFLSVLTTPAPGVVGRDVKVVDALRNAESAVSVAFPDQPEIRGDVCEEMAVTYAKLGETESAERYAREALRIRTEALGPAHGDTIVAMNNLANILTSAAHMEQRAAMEEARGLLDRAIEMLRRDFAGEPQRLLEPLSNRASLAYSERDYQTAERLTREQVTIAEKVHGERHAMTIMGHQNLAILLGQLGHPEQAVPEMRRVVDLLEQTAGPRDPSTLAARRALASTLRTLEQFDEAERIYRDNLPIVTDVLGPQHIETAVWHNELGFLLGLMKRREEAVEEYRAGVRIAEVAEANGFLVIVIKDSLSIALTELDRWDEAEPLLRDCTRGLAAIHGAAADSTLRSTYKLVDVLLHVNKVDEALSLSAEGLRLAEPAFAADTPTRAVMRAGVARSLLEAGRIEEARGHIDACIHDCPKITAEDHYVTRDAIEALAKSCEDAGLAAEAASLRGRVEE